MAEPKSGSALQGEREEWRRILHDGAVQWVRPDAEELVLGDGRRIAEAEAHYLAPCVPTKILCVHLNYESRVVEFGGGPLDTPTYFQKPTTAMNAHRGQLHRPADCQYLNYEGEVAAIVGKPMRNVAPDDTWAHLAGFAPANDVGCHDYRDTDRGGMTRVKGMDGFCPVGPGVVRGVDVRESTLRTWLNGRVVQEGKVSEMAFGIDYLLADLCRHITLLPGDVILTGTPAFSRPMQIGDVVEVEVSGLGRIRNTVAEIPAPAHGVGHQPTDTPAVRGVALGSDAGAAPGRKP
ncbi:MAG: 5-carboxymethyl-2-hydroxymuconate isomerase [Deltaproteobacteria bacterium]|jgi:5-oxopent-3-ene-1,2,5-tricarboxylate decarboxylase/2-hydroxyhepta-2,4-diene-1,7-dioate isomerase|nr:5-carboxymethyl-2-hydroxymuconate isomerase [Deltaproteobacteria bacterium]